MTDVINRSTEQSPFPYQALIEREAYTDAAGIIKNYHQWQKGEKPLFNAFFALGSQAQQRAHELFITEVNPHPDGDHTDRMITIDEKTLLIEWHRDDEVSSPFGVTYYSSLVVEA